jgi:hypothetical protein
LRETRDQLTERLTKQLAGVHRRCDPADPAGRRLGHDPFLARVRVPRFAADARARACPSIKAALEHFRPPDET